MLKRLVTYLVGHLRIEVTRGEIERFLNLAVEQGIYLWGIDRTADALRARISLSDFFAIRPVVRGSRCRVRILGRFGLPFVTARLRRRPTLMAGAIACVAFMLWASGHVWVVRVKITGPQTLDPRAVEAVAAEAGLKMGAWKGRIDVNKVQQHLEQKMGEISWAVVRLQGTRAVIEVVEKAAQRPPAPTNCINLVARKNGVIEQVIPFQGEPVVKKGDVVKAGDLLVECSLRYWGGGRPAVLPGAEKPPRDMVARTGVAQARVMARVTYRDYQEVPLEREVAIPTGRTATRWVLNWNGKSILQWGKSGSSFARSQEQRRAYSLGTWRNWKFPVEIIHLNIEEVETRKERVALSDLLTQARERVTSQLRWILGPTDQLLSPVSVEVAEKGKDFAGIRVSVDTLEEITQPQESKEPPATLPPPSPTPAQP